MATKGAGASEVGQTYMRAWQLCQHLEDPYQLFSVLHGLLYYYNARGEQQRAHALGEQLLTLAQQAQHSRMLVAAHMALGRIWFHLGVIASAHTHLTQGISLYDTHHHRGVGFLHGQDSGVACRSYAAWTLWSLGYPDQGKVRNDEAIILAQQVAHSFSLGHALSRSAVFHQLRQEVQAAQEHAEATISLATEQGFPFLMAVGSLLNGWALAHQGQAQEGIEQIHQGLRAHRATGSVLNQSYFLALLTEAHGSIEEPEAGLTVLTEALALVDTTGERWYEAELHRLKGAFLLQQSSDDQAETETCFQHAIRIAQSQHAKSWELRAATSLARLWQHQGKRAEARELLAPVYGWFTEGFDTADLQEAKALLDALA